MSRSGRPSELLYGPLMYGVIFVISTAYWWKESPIGIISVLVLCFGGNSYWCVSENNLRWICGLVRCWFWHDKIILESKEILSRDLHFYRSFFHGMRTISRNLFSLVELVPNEHNRVPSKTDHHNFVYSDRRITALSKRLGQRQRIYYRVAGDVATRPIKFQLFLHVRRIVGWILLRPLLLLLLHAKHGIIHKAGLSGKIQIYREVLSKIDCERINAGWNNSIYLGLLVAAIHE